MPHTQASADPPTEVRPPSPHAYFTAAAVVLAVAVMLALADQYTPVVITRGVFALLAALFVAGAVGYLMLLAEGRLRRQSADQAGKVEDRLAELTSQVEQLGGMVAGMAAEASRPKATGHACVSTAHGGTVRIARSAVDADTDPSGPSLQRAREEGIEQGFDIGLRTQLAELGVPTLPPLPRPRRSRLTGDS